ncbi:AAA family ATPase, partial [Kineococcus sp. SYSU DK001]|uniref:AAA family ATPase n=1 Tax=Kineococcus sp. SYSU DK001 TaxID=3383122 RepID=UPI003D7C7732
MELIGRAGVWRTLSELTQRPGAGGRAVLLTGNAGVGKTALLDALAERARTRGHHVLRTAGNRSGRMSSLTNLRELLQALPAPHLADLPERQAGVLHEVLREGTGEVPGAAPGPGAAPALLRLAVRSALEAAAGAAPLLLALDDVDRLDESTFDVLLPVLSSPPDGPVTVVATCREELVPRELGPVTEQLRVGPLDHAAAVELLEASGHRLPGRVREAVLRAGAGNPLALRELARSVAAGAAVEPVALSGALPVPQVLADVFARDLAGLADDTRRLLLLAACGESDVRVLLRAAGQPGTAAWEPAERRGLVSIDGERVVFRHPLVESHAYFSAPAGQRARAHRALAAALADRPEQAAWQLAAAATAPDDALAEHLAAVARAQRGGGGGGAGGRRPREPPPGGGGPAPAPPAAGPVRSRPIRSTRVARSP